MYQQMFLFFVFCFCILIIGLQRIELPSVSYPFFFPLRDEGNRGRHAETANMVPDWPGFDLKTPTREII